MICQRWSSERCLSLTPTACALIKGCVTSPVAYPFLITFLITPDSLITVTQVFPLFPGNLCGHVKRIMSFVFMTQKQQKLPGNKAEKQNVSDKGTTEDTHYVCVPWRVCSFMSRSASVCISLFLFYRFIAFHIRHASAYWDTFNYPPTLIAF